VIMKRYLLRYPTMESLLRGIRTKIEIRTEKYSVNLCTWVLPALKILRSALPDILLSETAVQKTVSLRR